MPRSDRSYLFVGGPWDGRQIKTGGLRLLRVPAPETLEGQLQMSIQLLRGSYEEVTPGPPMRVAQYILERRVITGTNITPIRNPWAYRFEGYE